MKKSAVFLVIFALALIGGCSQLSQNVNVNLATKSQISPQDNSQTSLDWQGWYKGVIPCADCAGIEQSLMINSDNSFILQSVYQNKARDRFEEKGYFKWDKTGSIISLSNNMKFKVSENKLLMLDADGQMVTGELANDYILHKIPNLVGADSDKHGCIGSAGYQWSEKKQRCIRPWLNN